eukprot:1744974-Rhodomonas_salina.6
MGFRRESLAEAVCAGVLIRLSRWRSAEHEHELISKRRLKEATLAEWEKTKGEMALKLDELAHVDDDLHPIRLQ